VVAAYWSPDNAQEAENFQDVGSLVNGGWVLLCSRQNRFGCEVHPIDASTSAGSVVRGGAVDALAGALV